MNGNESGCNSTLHNQNSAQLRSFEKALPFKSIHCLIFFLIDLSAKCITKQREPTTTAQMSHSSSRAHQALANGQRCARTGEFQEEKAIQIKQGEKKLTFRTKGTKYTNLLQNKLSLHTCHIYTPIPRPLPFVH